MTDKLTDKQIAAKRDQLMHMLPPSDISAALTGRAAEINRLTARIAELEGLLDEDNLTDIITGSIGIDWTPRDAAKAIVRAMGGDAT